MMSSADADGGTGGSMTMSVGTGTSGDGGAILLQAGSVGESGFRQVVGGFVAIRTGTSKRMSKSFLLSEY